MRNSLILAVVAALIFQQTDGFERDSKTKKCPYTHSEKSQNIWSSSALYLSVKAKNLLMPLLSQKNAAVYNDDDAYIADFPFCFYNVITVPNQGTYFINDINDYIKNILRQRKCWEQGNQQLMKKYVREGSLVLDIGAHIGTHTVALSRYVGKSGTVLAFEPNRAIHRELCYNLAANLCNNVYPLRSAAGKDYGVIEVVTPLAQNEGGSYVIESKGSSNSAAILPLDSFGLNNISFIKIDVENMEADVLDGAVETILRCRPVMLIEIQGNAERPRDLNEDSEQMAAISKAKIENLGYSLTRLGQSNDYLAIPL